MRTVKPSDPATTYAHVLDALPIVAYMTNTAGVVTYLSLNWKRFAGNSGDDVLEHGYHTVIHPDDLPHVEQIWAAARTAGTSYRDEFRLRITDDSYRYVVSQADPMRVADGTIVGWFGTLTDIDALRRAEADLARALAAATAHAREADARARFVERLLDASEDCVTMLDLEGRVVSLRKHAECAPANADLDSIAGLDWLTFWSPADQTAVVSAVNVARSGGRGRFTGRYAVEARERWWDVNVTPILDAHGAPEALLAVLRDVTATLRTHRALAESETRARVLRQALPGITWTATADGRFDCPHEAGPNASQARGDAWLQTVHPDDRERVQGRWQSSIAEGQPYDTLFRMQQPGGDDRWQLARALPQRDERGAIVRWVGVNIDVDDRHRAAEAREQFVRLAEASDDFISIADEHGFTTYVNEAGRRMLEIGSIDDISVIHLLDFFAADDREFVTADILPRIAREGRWLGEYRFCGRRSGAAVPVWLNAFALADDTGRPTGIATVSRDLRERLRVETGLRTLAEASTAMYRSLDFARTLENVAEAVTRNFASACTIDALDADGRITTIAAAHPDADMLEVFKHVAAVRNGVAGHPVARAIHHGEATLMANIPSNWLGSTGIEAALGAAVERLHVTSLIFVPIRSALEDRVIAALCCGMDERDPRGAYTAEDLRFAQEVAVRAGLALDHARAYERERRIAMTLQEASLPGVLPLVDHLYLSAHYHPGNSEATIGGDWYDAFALDDGRIAITIGDVIGSGLAAAVTMGKVRQAMRAVATVLPEPHAMLDVADRTVRAVSDDTYATAVAGIFDPIEHTYTFAAAGHPGPIVRYADGRIEEFTSAGILLGLRERGETASRCVPVPPGSMLVFFTDGLVESTHDSAEGHRRVHAALADEEIAVAPNPASSLVARVLSNREATDDIAVLIAEVGPSSRFDALGRTAAQRARDLGYRAVAHEVPS